MLEMRSGIFRFFVIDENGGVVEPHMRPHLTHMRETWPRISDSGITVDAWSRPGLAGLSGRHRGKTGARRRYERSYGSDYGFESVMVAARSQLILEILRSSNHDVIIEVGCGSDLLVDSAAAAGLTWRRWIVVEPAERFAALADQAARRHGGATVVNAFVEDAVERVASATENGADIVLCSSVLHEVDDERAST